MEIDADFAFAPLIRAPTPPFFENWPLLTRSRQSEILAQHVASRSKAAFREVQLFEGFSSLHLVVDRH